MIADSIVIVMCFLTDRDVKKLINILKSDTIIERLFGKSL